MKKPQMMTSQKDYDFTQTDELIASLVHKFLNPCDTNTDELMKKTLLIDGSIIKRKTK
tara:strand:+ start:814 stop:987 length:174 start_codon:yes stop_codon:yes gene_type:complete